MAEVVWVTVFVVQGGVVSMHEQAVWIMLTGVLVSEPSVDEHCAELAPAFRLCLSNTVVVLVLVHDSTSVAVYVTTGRVSAADSRPHLEEINGVAYLAE